MCVAAARHSEKFTKILYFKDSKWFKVINVRTPQSSSAVLVTISNKSASICNRCHARLVNNN